MIKIKPDWNEYVRQQLREIQEEMITIMISGEERKGMSSMGVAEKDTNTKHKEVNNENK